MLFSFVSYVQQWYRDNTSLLRTDRVALKVYLREWYESIINRIIIEIAFR